MAETITIARPYARAAFEEANSKKGGLKRWSDFLHVAAGVVANDDMKQVLASPALSSEEKAELILGLCGDLVDGKGPIQSQQNFVQLLAENERLVLLPEILSLFEDLRAEAEKTIQAQLISAYPVSDEQRDRVAAALKKRLNLDVQLDVQVDETLLGGAIIRAGDLVIDGSAQGQLAKLAHALS